MFDVSTYRSDGCEINEYTYQHPVNEKDNINRPHVVNDKFLKTGRYEGEMTRKPISPLRNWPCENKTDMGNHKDSTTKEIEIQTLYTLFLFWDPWVMVQDRKGFRKIQTKHIFKVPKSTWIVPFVLFRIDEVADSLLSEDVYKFLTLVSFIQETSVFLFRSLCNIFV